MRPGAASALRAAWLAAIATGSLVALLVVQRGWPLAETIAGCFALGAAALAGFAWRSRLAAAQDDSAVETRRRGGPVTGAIARAALASLPEPALIIAPPGRVVFENETAVQLLGSGTGKPLATLLRAPAVLQAGQAALTGALSGPVEFTMPVPVERHFEVSAVPLPGGAETLALLLLREVTTQRRVERMRADFVANASHELRTPLASLSGFIDTLRGPARDDAEARERFLEIMRGQAARMRGLIDDLLSLSRVELNEHLAPSGAVDLEALAHDVIDAVQPLLKDQRLTCTLEAQPGLPRALGDRHELIQVVQNLVDNAIKYGAGGGEITITVGEGPDPDGPGPAPPWLRFSVADRGPGIAREHLPRLTERFYRVDVGASRERGGTGLGLAIVKHIVNRHRGRLEIESEPGQGSQFTVLLPPAPPMREIE